MKSWGLGLKILQHMFVFINPLGLHPCEFINNVVGHLPKTNITGPRRKKSEWLFFNTNSAIFQLYHGENKLIDNEMMRYNCFVKDQHAQLDFYSASSLKQQSTDRHVTPLLTHYPDSKPIGLCTCKWSIWNRSVDLIFQSLWFLSGFPS